MIKYRHHFTIKQEISVFINIKIWLFYGRVINFHRQHLNFLDIFAIFIRKAISFPRRKAYRRAKLK